MYSSRTPAVASNRLVPWRQPGCAGADGGRKAATAGSGALQAAYQGPYGPWLRPPRPSDRTAGRTSTM
jgi:hypothetical protein